MVAGFTLPLYMLSGRFHWEMMPKPCPCLSPRLQLHAGILSTAALLLMLPEPLSKPIKMLCKSSSRSQVGEKLPA